MSQRLAIDYIAHGEGTGWRRGQELIDALPYIDPLPADVKRKVEQLIEEELARSSKRPADYLKELPPMPSAKFEGHPMLLQDYERVKSSQPLPPLDTSRYRLDPPPQARRNDYSAWRAALDNAHAQLEHQLLRLDNLELALKYSANSWRAQVQVGESASKRLEEELAAVKKSVDGLNRERKMQQTAIGVELRQCEEEWLALVMKCSDIERACDILQMEVDHLQAQLPRPAPSGAPPAGEEPSAAETSAGVQANDKEQAAAAGNGVEGGNHGPEVQEGSGSHNEAGNGANGPTPGTAADASDAPGGSAGAMATT